MKLTLNGATVNYNDGDTYLDLARELGREALGVRVGGRTLPLGAKIRPEERAELITYDWEEGARIYERSLRFVLLWAVKQLFTDAHVRIENSTSAGIFASVRGARLDEARARQIKERMRDIIRQDLPFTLVDISREEAIAHFLANGNEDKARLLKYRPFEHFHLYRLGDMEEYFYGVMAPSTGFVRVFDLRFYLPGLELALPDPAGPDRPTPFCDQPKLMATFAQSARWARILGCENAADLNDMTVKRGLREFIRVNEALHEKSISDIAQRFIESGASLILVAGPSSSGKTTFAHRLSIALRVHGLKPMRLSMDDYYLDRDTLPRDENGELDLERVDTLDIDLFNRHLVSLLQNEPVDAPTFDFVSGRRGEKTTPLLLSPGQPVLVEGIHALNPVLTSQVPRERKFLIYTSALTTLNLDDHNRIRTTDVRLLRRIVRDHLFRGTPPEQTLGMWESVRRGETNYIFPYQEQADVMFNSTLVYELPILKKYAYPMLAAIGEDSPYYTRARRLVKFLNYFVAANVEDEIPNNSILREFIGGCCFYREED